MNLLFLLSTGLFFVCGFCISLFLIIFPRRSIQLQQSFYALINWRMEPISWEKEMRNTRLMGGLILFLLLANLVVLLRR